MNFLELSDAVAEARKVVAKHQKVLSDLLSQCTHDEYTLEELYTSGGYDYCAETTYSNQCTLCGKHLDIVTKIHHNIHS